MWGVICVKCDKDLADCTCPDLKERFESILRSEFIYIGPEYEQRIRQQIERERSESELTMRRYAKIDDNQNEYATMDRATGPSL